MSFFANINAKKGYSIFFLCFLFSLASLNLGAATPIPPPPYTKTQVQNYLTKAWAGYKAAFILSTGQVIRPEDGNDTVSEGQAYAMLISVGVNDKITFDKCFAWTEANLSRNLPGSSSYGGPDNLLAWHWLPQGGVQGDGWNAATDADEDYAYALLLAYEKWGQVNYLSKALAVLNDILAKETYDPLLVPNVLFLKPGNWGEGNIYGHQGIFLNPSYLSPGWYRKFNTYLPDARWQQLIDGSYYILSVAKDNILDPATNMPVAGVGMLPDWAFIDDLGVVYFQGDINTNIALTISSWDAFRLSWRIYQDLKITNETETRAQDYLNQLKSFYQSEFDAGRKIFASYYYDGTAVVNYTSPATSGIPLLSASFDPSVSITSQSGMPQTAMAYIIKSAPTNPPLNNQFSGPDTFQESRKSGYFQAPGDIVRYYINSWGVLGLLTAFQTP